MPGLLTGLGALSAVVLAAHVPGRHATAWHFFHDAGRLLAGGDGLHLYGGRPDFQFGPLSIVVALPFTALGETVGSWTAMVAMSAAGLVVVALLLDIVPRPRPVVAVVAGAVAVITWGDVAVRTAHLDDAVALLAVVAALRWCHHSRAGLVTAALAVAAAAKPWAAMFAPIALVPPGAWPARWGRLAAIGGFVALTWAPFVLAEPDTLDTARFAIDNDATSVLRAFGVDDATTPGWVRPVQIAGGALVVAVAVAARQWPAALLLGITWRLLLEPGAHRYYTVGVVLGALLVELLRRPGRVPWVTVAAAVVLEVTALPDFPGSPGAGLRLVGLLTITILLCGAHPVTRARVTSG